MSSESSIRDLLGRRLDLLESGLTLIDAEFHLPNKFGSFGFVDLVARDRYRNIVLIELKRDDAPARQAIHELFKYVALIQQNHGIPTEKLRCIIVSTSWRELHVPFSEYQRIAPYPVEGFRLAIDEDGVPQAAERVEPLSENREVTICPFQTLVFCDSPQVRAALSTKCSNELQMAGLGHVVLIEMEYAGDSHPFPYAFCAVIGQLDIAIQTRVKEENLLGAAQLVTELEQSEDYEEWPVEAAITGVIPSLIRTSHYDHNTEICYPEKLRGAIASGWKVGNVVRLGTLFSSEKLYSDDDIVKWCTGVEGENPISYSVVTSPRFRQRWEEVIDRIVYVLRGHPLLSSGTKLFLKTCETISPNGTMVIDIYYPFDFLSQLAMALKSEDCDYLPRVDVFFVGGENNILVLSGRVMWNGVTVSTRPHILMSQIFGDQFSYELKRHMHDTSENEAAVLSAMNLEWVLISSSFDRNGDLHSSERFDGVEWRSMFKEPTMISGFAERNAAWCSEFVDLIIPGYLE